MTYDELRARWATRREEYQRLGVQLDGARVVEAFLADLEEMVHDQAGEVLSLERAALLSGYSLEHLARLVREGKLPNAGRKGKPLIRRADLPRKPPCSLASSGSRLYDPQTDARFVRTSQRWRETHDDS